MGHAGKPVHSKIFGWVQEVSWNWKQLIIYHPWSRNNCLPKLLGWFGWFQFALTWTSHLKLTSHVLFTFEPGSHMTYQGDGGALNPLRHQSKKTIKTKISYFISLHYTLDGGCVLTSYVEQISVCIAEYNKMIPYQKPSLKPSLKNHYINVFFIDLPNLTNTVRHQLCIYIYIFIIYILYKYIIYDFFIRFV